MRLLRYILPIALLCILLQSCSVTRRIPDGEYFLQKVKIEEDNETPKQERITSDQMEKYVRQSPTKRFLGTNLYVWLYNLANPEKDNGWNRFKRRIGKAPVLYDDAMVQTSAGNLKIYVDSRGYYSSEVTYDVDTVRRPKRAYVTYHITQGEPYRISSLDYDFRDRPLGEVIAQDTSSSLIRVGEILDIPTLDKERERIATYLKERGYYNFSVNNIEYMVDTLAGRRMADVTMVVKQTVSGYNDRGEPIMDNNTIYHIGDINLFPNYEPTIAVTDPDYLMRLDTLDYEGLRIISADKLNVRKGVLRSIIPLHSGELFDSRQVERTYQDIMSMGYFKSARISFAEQKRDTTLVDTTSVAGVKEGLLQCNILCTPALKQSFRVELEASATSSFYGVSATVGYQHRNIFKGAEALDISGTAGYEYMKTPKANKRHAIEFGITAGLSFPNLLLPMRTTRLKSVNQPKTRLQVSMLYQDRPYYRRTLAGATWSYSWSNNRYSSFMVAPASINVIDMKHIDEAFLASISNPYLRESYKSQLVAGITGSYTYNNQRRNLGGDATLVHLNWETAGNLIQGLETLFSQEEPGTDYYTILGLRYAQYFRVDLSLSHKFMLGAKTAIAARVMGGFGMSYGNGQTVPYDRLFYAGGSNSMRGWTPRTLGPGSQLADEYRDDYVGGNYYYPQQMGNIKLEANLEFRFPIWGKFFGATFLDAGNVWYMKGTDPDPDGIFHIRDFYKQLGFNTGLGVRLDIKLAVLRLDWGLQLHNPNRPEGERWIHDFKWKGMALNFGVGYPF